MFEPVLRHFGHGGFVILVEDRDPYRGVLVLAAEHATPSRVAFMVKHTAGVVCVALPTERLRALHLPLMAGQGGAGGSGERFETGKVFAVSVDYKHGTTTGISAEERAATLRALVDPNAGPEDFARPGHVFPLCAPVGGVLERPGVTEAALDLARLAKGKPGTVLSELVNYDGELAGRPEVMSFALTHGIPILSVEDVVAACWREEGLLEEVDAREVATDAGRFLLWTYRERATGQQHVAVSFGPAGGLGLVPVRIHAPCLRSEIFGAAACGCGSGLSRAVSLMISERRGIVIYLHVAAGRTLVSGGSVPRSASLGAPDCATVNRPGADTEFAGIVAARILEDLGVRAVRLLGASPTVAKVLEELGFDEVELLGWDGAGGGLPGERALLPPLHSDRWGSAGPGGPGRRGMGYLADTRNGTAELEFLWAG